MLKVILMLFVLFSPIYGQTAQTDAVTVFREAVFSQNISVSQAQGMYREAEQQVRQKLTGWALYAELSRLEYFMGRVYQDHNQKNEAVSRFEEGLKTAELSLKLEANAKAYEMVAQNTGQLCMLKPQSWVMLNGTKVEENAKKALKLDAGNAGAAYLLASRWAFGPGVFGNPKRGITELLAILDGYSSMQRNDYFNVYSALSYACLRLDRHGEALVWIDKALEFYPTNKFALDLKSQIIQKTGTTR